MEIIPFVHNDFRIWHLSEIAGGEQEKAVLD
jgi:hypothetical protein